MLIIYSTISNDYVVHTQQSTCLNHNVSAIAYSTKPVNLNASLTLISADGNRLIIKSVPVGVNNSSYLFHFNNRLRKDLLLCFCYL